MYKIFNGYKQISSHFYYENFKKMFSKSGKILNAFLQSLFISRPYSFEEDSSIKKDSNYKNITDFYLMESRRTFL